MLVVESDESFLDVRWETTLSDAIKLVCLDLEMVLATLTIHNPIAVGI